MTAFPPRVRVSARCRDAIHTEFSWRRVTLPFDDNCSPRVNGLAPLCNAVGSRDGAREGPKSIIHGPNGFTDAADAFARANRIALLDGKIVLTMLQRLSAEIARLLPELPDAISEVGEQDESESRERSEDPFTSLGAVTLAEEPTGNRPMSITWKLKVPIPLALFQRYSVLRG